MVLAACDVRPIHETSPFSGTWASMHLDLKQCVHNSLRNEERCRSFHLLREALGGQRGGRPGHDYVCNPFFFFFCCFCLILLLCLLHIVGKLLNFDTQKWPLVHWHSIYFRGRGKSMSSEERLIWWPKVMMLKVRVTNDCVSE
jgi:hypothetical protein